MQTILSNSFLIIYPKSPELIVYKGLSLLWRSSGTWSPVILDKHSGAEVLLHSLRA